MIEVKEGTLEELAGELIRKLSGRKDFFHTAKILIPSGRLKDWFKAYYLSHRSDVLMNVDFSLIPDGLLSLLPERPYFRFAKKRDVRNLLLARLSHYENVGELDPEIQKYLDPDGTSYSSHLYDLSDALASLFLEYDQTGFEPESGQKILFDAVLKELEERRLGTLKSIGERLLESDGGEDILVFGTARIPTKEEEIIRNYGKKHSVIIYKVCSSKSPEFFYSASASKTTEVQILHSEICRLCGKEGVSYKDFLVVAPDISEYEQDIRKVFTQDGKEYPDIPFVLSGPSSSLSEDYNALSKMREILIKGFCDRLDFVSLLQNKAVQEARALTPDDISVFADSIVSMNAYRNGESGDDWLYVFKRIVLSKFLDVNQKGDSVIELGGDEYEPYANLSFGPEQCVKLCSFISDLEDLMKYKDAAFLKPEEIPPFLELLGRFLSVKDENGNEQNPLYRNLLKEGNALSVSDFGKDGVPFEALLRSLSDAVKNSSSTGGELFTSGVSFVSYLEEAVLSDRYVFFLGGSSNAFPNNPFSSELDQRPEKDLPRPEYAYFRLQAFCGAEEFHYSYVYKDSATDEEFYPSSFYLKLNGERKENEGKEPVPVFYGLDEKRPYSELFTRKEYKDKDYFSSLLKGGEEDKASPSVFKALPEPPATVYLSQMKDFLTEPLKYRSDQLFGKGDDSEERLREEYEPLDYDTLTEYKVFSSLLEKLYVLNADAFPEEEEKALWKEFVRNREIPFENSAFSYGKFDQIAKKAERTKKDISEAHGDGFRAVRLPDLSFDTDSGKATLVSMNTLLRKEDGNALTYFPLKEFKESKPGLSDFIPLYLSALMDVAGREEGTYGITLCVGRKETRSFGMTKESARTYLKKIYGRMNNPSSVRAYPVNCEENKNLPNDPFELNQSLRDQNAGVWKYFDNRNLFRQESLGYSEEGFRQEFQEEAASVGELIGPLLKEKTEKKEHE